MGAHYRSSSSRDVQDFKVERIINHENYKRPRGLAHDIAMLKLNKPAKINDKVGLACLPAYSQDVTEIDDKDCWVTGITRTLLKAFQLSLASGAPNDNFRKNICSEDDLRSRIFETFVVKFLACLPLLGFSNIQKMVYLPIFNGFLP